MDISINKNSFCVLLQLLQGRGTATKISEHTPSIDIRSVQRGLNRLTELGIAIKKGTNHLTEACN